MIPLLIVLLPVVNNVLKECQLKKASHHVVRRRYHSCGDNHGIKPPSPEQYLTPLQQKVVMIRHLRSQLTESEMRYRERSVPLTSHY